VLITRAFCPTPIQRRLVLTGLHLGESGFDWLESFFSKAGIEFAEFRRFGYEAGIGALPILRLDLYRAFVRLGAEQLFYECGVALKGFLE